MHLVVTEVSTLACKIKNTYRSEHMCNDLNKKQRTWIEKYYYLNAQQHDDAIATFQVLPLGLSLYTLLCRVGVTY